MDHFDVDALAGDPTQRLLTCLGRFQRLVTSACQSDNGTVWVSEAAARLDAGRTIAEAEGWNSAAFVLTETRRMLEACEGAGAADLAIPHLKEAYDLLCLMVGDLIVGNPRASVRRRFNSWHEDTRAKLASAGIALAEPEPWPEDAPYRTAAGCLTKILIGWLLG